MLGRGRDRLIQCQERFGVTPQFDQGSSAAVQSLCIFRGPRKNVVKTCKRSVMLADSRSCDTAIEKRVTMSWAARKDSIKTANRFAWTIENVQHVSSID